MAALCLGSCAARRRRHPPVPSGRDAGAPDRKAPADRAARRLARCWVSRSWWRRRFRCSRRTRSARARRQLRAEMAPAALESALSARGLPGMAPSPHLQIALVSEQAVRARCRPPAIGEAIDRTAPIGGRGSPPRVLEAKAGRPRSARERLRQARRLNPRSNCSVDQAADSS